ncbi:MAG: esterase, partial [Gemmatimonas sp.]
MSTSPGDIRIHTRPTVRTARYSVLGTEPAEAQRVWFVLHGYGQLAPRFLRHFAGAVPPDTCVVAPEGLSRF